MHDSLTSPKDLDEGCDQKSISPLASWFWTNLLLSSSSVSLAWTLANHVHECGHSDSMVFGGVRMMFQLFCPPSPLNVVL